MLKYRARRTDSKEIVEGFLVVDKDGVYHIFTGNYYFNGTYTHYDKYLVIPKTVGMNTLLIDINGKRIFASIPLHDGKMSTGGDRVRLISDKLYKDDYFTHNTKCGVEYGDGSFYLNDDDVTKHYRLLDYVMEVLDG